MARPSENPHGVAAASSGHAASGRRIVGMVRGTELPIVPAQRSICAPRVRVARVATRGGSMHAPPQPHSARSAWPAAAAGVPR